MKVAVLEFATRSLLGIVDDAGAEVVTECFNEPASGTDEDVPSLVRLEWPARIEVIPYMDEQASALAGAPKQAQLVSRPFAVLVGVSRLTVDVGQALAAEVFDVTEANVASVDGNGVTPARASWSSDEPLVAIYLQALERVVDRGLGRRSGRQRVVKPATQ